jgi:hypothetical protein
MSLSEQSSTPLLAVTDEEHDIESKVAKIETKNPASDETSFNTQAFWLLVWMTKLVNNLYLMNNICCCI